MNSTGGHLGYGDSKNPELQFENGAEAAVAAYLVELLTSRSNSIAVDITERLGSVIAAEIAELEPDAEDFHLESVEAVVVRRTIGDVALGALPSEHQLQAIPPSVIQAAKQMHFGAEAHEIGSMQPTALVPADLDPQKAPEDLRAAVADIAQRKTLPLSPAEPTTQSAELAIYLDHMLDSVEPPIAA